MKVLTLANVGDQAVVAHFETEADALALAAALRQAHWPDVVDIVPAYRRVAVFFDPDLCRLDRFRERLASFIFQCPSSNFVGVLHEIPCCYELGPDLAVVANATRLTSAEVIDYHTGTEYTVYAIGFTPGFPYLGYLPAPLCGVPRRASPRVRVPAGSVGLTGRQTGIYPMERPGGWCLIGQTPLQIVDVASGYFPIRVGDRVRFRAISRQEFERLHGKRLPMT